MSYDSLTNRGDYLSPHYLAEVLPRELAKRDGLRSQWVERDKTGGATPVKELRGLRRGYFAVRPDLADFAERTAAGELITDDERRTHDKTLKKTNDDLLRALGFAASREVVDVERSGETIGVPVAYHGQNVVAIDCAWAADTDAALGADLAGRLLDPVQIGGSEWITTGAKLARWLFDTDEPPRYVLLLHGGVVILADRVAWAEGRYLAVSMDTAIDRADQAELETIAALFSADVLQPPAEGGSEQLAQWVDESRKHAIGVSGELREGLRESVQIIANEVLDRIRSHGLAPEEVMGLGDLAREVGREALRYLYRILFLLYAEARPELGILPADDQDYVAGYSMQRMGELVARRLIGEEARTGFHLYESLDLLFRMVNNGHRARGHASTEGLSEGEGLRFESLKADLFEPSKTRLIGRIADPRYDDADGGEAPLLDTRLRDEALYKVLRRLMLAKGSGRKGKNQRGGFISYAQLGINQLGAVYEGLMSYTGFIATEELYEVAKKGDPSGGSWMIPASKVSGYADDVFVMEKDENGFATGERVRYRPGSFVYRLAGRDRQTSASYYTPQSLTSVTVQLALEQRVKEEGRPVTAAEVLHWRVCEPALGSGAFLNEAIDQLAALYLRLREEETGDRLEPDERALDLQKIKAYIALHNCYGVDLNETAVELAEVSIWLNVMHRGLQAPWFGLHLVRGNSLIGAGRRLYPPEKLAKGEWLKSAPEDVPFSAGEIPAGHIHHFLLPAEGWGAVAGEKEAKELVPSEAKRLADWRKAIRRTPGKPAQVRRLQALAGRAEYLWSLVIERLRISEREISRTIDVWGAEDLPVAQEAKPRDEILADLTSPGTPFWRLKTVMDAWCALWFWPIDKAALLDGSDDVYAAEPQPEPVVPEPTPVFPTTYVKASLFDDEPEQLTLAAAPKPRIAKRPLATRRSVVPLKDFEDWLEFAESVLGRQDIPADSLIGNFTRLQDLSDYEDQLELYMGMDPFYRLSERFPWLDTVVEISQQQGFFHWELQFAQVFSEGGFDLQLGNPPWVRPDWDEPAILAELDPWFMLAEKPLVKEYRARKGVVIAQKRARMFFLDELTMISGIATFLADTATYPLITGTRPDFYRGFMYQTWAHAGPSGTVGLLHPDTHLEGVRESRLRSAAYHRLRMHASFVNGGNWAFPPPISRTLEFGMHVYGSLADVRFMQASSLYGATVFTESLHHDEAGELPRIKYKRHWDIRPHKARIIQVDQVRLELWRALLDRYDQPLDETPLVHVITTAELGAMAKLARFDKRLGDNSSRISIGFIEAEAKKYDLIRDQVSTPGVWSETILQGPHFFVATPFAKQPPHMGNFDDPHNLRTLPVDAVPATKYRRACDPVRYRKAQDQWLDYGSTQPVSRPYSEFYRIAWRKMIADNGERSLISAILPPGPTHIDSILSMAMRSNRETALSAGFWASISLDYLLRVTGKSNLHSSDVRMMPMPDLDHLLAGSLMLRTLRLNCLTNAYADLWGELYDPIWRAEGWVYDWPGMDPLGQISAEWTWDTPLRTEYARRAALVEIDALVAVWLGFKIEEFLAAYESRFGVLAGYEEEMYFDANGRKLAANHNAYGLGQTKEHWKQFELYLEDPDRNSPPDGYTAPFYKADRIAEYRQAHAVFKDRLQKARDVRS
ncbi:MAG: class I SAM-dependent DNA methyltransferase [Streptosporangiaceae bacterium]|nr:class I SAM-dependent DNA methyltransferase [Streptosporangiaceae bacterium]